MKTWRCGDRVRVPDGRVGRVLWTIPSGTETAVALDGVYGSLHISPEYLEPESEQVFREAIEHYVGEKL